MNNTSRNLNLSTKSAKELLEYSLNSLACRQSRLSCTPSEYKEIEKELNDLKKLAHKIQANDPISRSLKA